MKIDNLDNVIKKILSETADKGLVNQIIKKLKDASSQYSWTLGAGTDEEAFVSAIQEIPNFETAKEINNQYNLRDAVDDEFNFNKEDDFDYWEQIFQHMESIGVKVINPDDQKTFDFDFSKNRLGGGVETTPGGSEEKQQDQLISTNKCIAAPTLSSICSGKAFLKNCMKGDKSSTEDAVYKVQQFLISKGFKKVSKSGNPDWVYGPLTASMVKQYQKSVNIKADGIAGPQTVSTMGICTTSSQQSTIAGPDVVTTTTNNTLTGSVNTTLGASLSPDINDIQEVICDVKDKKVIRAYNSIKEGMGSNDPSYLRRECKIVIDYQSENEQHCDNLEEVICFCGTKASSGDDGYNYLGDQKNI